MKKKILISLLVLMSQSYVQAYTWKINNQTDKQAVVHVKTTMVGKGREQIKKVPVNKTVDFKFSGWQVGACLDEVIVKIWDEGGEFAKTFSATDLSKLDFFVPTTCKGYTFIIRRAFTLTGEPKTDGNRYYLERKE